MSKSEKRQLIDEMLEMQRAFIAHEHAHGFEPASYYTPPEGHPLAGYRKRYRDLAMQVVDMAHAERRSKP